MAWSWGGVEIRAGVGWCCCGRGRVGARTCGGCCASGAGAEGAACSGGAGRDGGVELVRAAGPGDRGRVGLQPQDGAMLAARFNPSGVAGLEDLGGQGRERRIAEAERSRIIAPVKTLLPGRLRWEPIGELWAPDELGPTEWMLSSLASAAKDEGIRVGRLQVRRILLVGGVRWRRPRARPGDPTHFPCGCRLVTRRASDQSRTRLRPRAAEDLGVRGITHSRRLRGHDGRALPQ